MTINNTAFHRWRLNEDGELEKQCTKCGEWLYADQEFFSPHPYNYGRLQSHCIFCRCEYIRLKRIGVKKNGHCSQYIENGYTCTNCPMPIDGCPVEMKRVKLQASNYQRGRG